MLSRAVNGEPCGVVVVIGGQEAWLSLAGGDPHFGDRDAEPMIQVGAGEGGGVFANLRRCALGDDPAAMRACAGAEFDEVICGLHHGLIVLNDEDGIAEVSQSFQGADEAFIIRWMKADAGLIEDVEDSCKPCADLRGEPDALGFATGKGAALAIQCQVAEPHIAEKLQPLQDLALEIGGVGALVFREGKGLHPGEGIADRQRGVVVDVLLRGSMIGGEGDAQCLGPQTFALADGAGLWVHQAGELTAQRIALRIQVEALNLGKETFERLGKGSLGGSELPPGGNGFRGAVQEGVLELDGGGFVGHIDPDLKVACQRLNATHVTGLELWLARPPAFDRAIGYRERWIWNQKRGVRCHDGADAFAGRAGTSVGVEGEVLGREFFEDVTRGGIGVGGGECQQFLPAIAINEKLDFPLVPLQCGLDAVHEPTANPFAQDEPIHHDLDAVFLAAWGLELVIEFLNDTVETDPNEALAAQFFKEATQITLFRLDDGGEEDESRALRQGKNALPDFCRGVFDELLAGGGVVWLPGDGVKDAQIVVDLRDGRDGAARVGCGVNLLDGDRGAEAFDEIDVGFFQLVQKLPCVGAKALDIAALAFGVEGIKGQGRFARPADTRQHHEAIPRDIDIDVFEIVLSCAAHSDGVWGHGETLECGRVIVEWGSPD